MQTEYDGTVVRTESDEYVEIRNYGPAAQNVTGWKVLSVRDSLTYTFPTFVVAVGQTCRVYTNQVHPESCGLSWGRSSEVWNNLGDRAHLINTNGVVVSSRGYLGW